MDEVTCRETTNQPPGASRWLLTSRLILLKKAKHALTPVDEGVAPGGLADALLRAVVAPHLLGATHNGSGHGRTADHSGTALFGPCEAEELQSGASPRWIRQLQQGARVSFFSAEAELADPFREGEVIVVRRPECGRSIVELEEADGCLRAYRTYEIEQISDVRVIKEPPQRSSIPASPQGR